MWLPEDRDVVAIWQEEQTQKCPQCGTFAWEWEGDEVPYHPDHWTCFGCESNEQYQIGLVDAHLRKGTKFGLFRSERSGT